jgi:hypothetical protein
MPRPSKPNAERLSTLQQRLAKVQRDIRLARAQEKNQARRDDARRKIIAGALALEHFEKYPGSEFGKILFGLLDEYARPEDRVLFAFLPVREALSPPLPAPDISDAAE